MAKILEKVERRLGEKLFIKGDRCMGPKCAAVRRGYPPGIHGKKRSRGRGASEFSTLLREKQKVHFFYGLDDRDIKRYTFRASRAHGLFSDMFLQMLESRLDTVVWRLGFAESHRAARQAITHGHIAVNGRGVRVPSYQAHKGNVISIRERAAGNGRFSSLVERLAHYEPPKWFALNKEKKSGTIIDQPHLDEIGMTFDLTKIKEFYSR